MLFLLIPVIGLVILLTTLLLLGGLILLVSCLRRPSRRIARSTNPINVTVLGEKSSEKTTSDDTEYESIETSRRPLSLSAPQAPVPPKKQSPQPARNKRYLALQPVESVDQTRLIKLQQFEDSLVIVGALRGLTLQGIHLDIRNRSVRICRPKGNIYCILDRPTIHGFLRLSRKFQEEEANAIASQFTGIPDKSTLEILARYLTPGVILAALTNDRVRISLAPHEDGKQLYGITLSKYTPLNKVEVRHNLVEIARGYFPDQIKSKGILLDEFGRPCELWRIQLEDRQIVAHLVIQYCLSNGYAGVRIGPPNHATGRKFGHWNGVPVNIGEIDWRHNQDPEELYRAFHEMIAHLAEVERV